METNSLIDIAHQTRVRLENVLHFRGMLHGFYHHSFGHNFQSTSNILERAQFVQPNLETDRIFVYDLHMPMRNTVVSSLNSLSMDQQAISDDRQYFSNLPEQIARKIVRKMLVLLIADDHRSGKSIVIYGCGLR